MQTSFLCELNCCKTQTRSNAKADDEDDDQTNGDVWNPVAGILHEDNFVYVNINTVRAIWSNYLIAAFVHCSNKS